MKRKHKLALGASIVALAGLGGVKAQASSVQEIINAAVPVANDYGLYPSVMIAQGILESSSGQSGLASNYNNIFGVKYTSGNPVYLPTQEYVDGAMVNVVEPFQAYASLYDACVAQAQLLRSSSYYSGAWRENTSSYLDATAWLEGRYATDPTYASKLNSIIAELGLSAYDEGGQISAGVTSVTTTSVTTTSSASTNAAGTYKVQEGDSLSAIAAQYGTTVDALVSANSLENANDIHVGEVLQVSGTASTASATRVTSTSTSSAQTGSYTVQSGDSLYSIAEQNGLSVSALMAINGISDVNSMLQVGQSLQISSTSSTTSTRTVSTSSYTIQNGDSLYSIATAHGMTADQLAAINGFSLNQMIHPGQTIQV